MESNYVWMDGWMDGCVDVCEYMYVCMYPHGPPYVSGWLKPPASKTTVEYCRICQIYWMQMDITEGVLGECRNTGHVIIFPADAALFWGICRFPSTSRCCSTLRSSPGIDDLWSSMSSVLLDIFYCFSRQGKKIWRCRVCTTLGASGFCMNMYDFLEVADYDDEDSIDRVIRTWWPKVFSHSNHILS